MAVILPCYLIIPFLLPYVTAQNNGSITPGSTLTAGNGDDPWLSPARDFAFGFHQLEGGLFLLAIWYNNITNKTIIWYANGDNPAPRGSRLELNDSRGLVLSNPQGEELWRSDLKSGTVSNGLMNDTGNLVLLGQNSESLWNSFSRPTDTLVPTQTMELNGTLFSRTSETNFTKGRFLIRLQNDGNWVFIPVNSPTNTSYDPYDNSGTADYGNKTNVGLRVIFDKSGFIYILKKSGDKFYITQPNDSFSTNEYYYKATINFDGVFTISYHPKNSSEVQGWTLAKAIPENICTGFNERIGQGVCGYNSICTLSSDKRPMCECPEGYSPIQSNDMYGGCMPNFQVVCQAIEQKGSKNEDQYIMKNLQNTDWPLSDYEIYSPYNVDDCKSSCLHDCLCVVSYFEGNSCWKKKQPLSFGRRDEAVKGIAFMKLMNKPLMPSSDHVKKDQNTLITVISVLFGSSIFIIFILLGAICYGCFLYNHKNHKKNSPNKNAADSNLRNFTFKELAEATNNFRDELGRGSCGIVYKGTIEMTSIAVKKLDKILQDSDKEFKTEVNVIGQTHHRNLVRLLGYCDEGQHRILVYEFMSNGTLASFLFGGSKPNWKQRVDVAFGIARGLVYLHEECFRQIIHCDIKPQNILLDEHNNARISDFGLAKLLMINQSHTETGIRGTKGYVAPDWFRSAPITVKVDVYSFGVLLLEIILCKKNVDKDAGSEELIILTDWVYDCFRVRRLDILVENDDEAASDMKNLERFVRITIWCLQEDPSMRPTMNKVMLMMEGIVPVKVPPSPSPFSAINYSRN